MPFGYAGPQFCWGGGCADSRKAIVYRQCGPFAVCAYTAVQIWAPFEVILSRFLFCSNPITNDRLLRPTLFPADAQTPSTRNGKTCCTVAAWLALTAADGSFWMYAYRRV